MAQEVVNLVARTACRQCLVWAKSDLLVRLVKELDPSQAVGYVVLNETAAARAAGMHRLLRMPQAGVVALHFGMASPEVVQVGGWVGGAGGLAATRLSLGRLACPQVGRQAAISTAILSPAPPLPAPAWCSKPRPPTDACTPGPPTQRA
jgi:hypothetical protein